MSKEGLVVTENLDSALNFYPIFKFPLKSLSSFQSQLIVKADWPLNYEVKSPLHKSYSKALRARGGPGSFLHVWLIQKYVLLLKSSFLRTKLLRSVKKLLSLR